MEIKCREKYEAALAYAEKTGDKTFRDCLDRLMKWETNRKCDIILYRDSSPFSFYFEMTDKTGNRVINGGLLYHGNPDESFAVQIEPATGWQIHT